MVTKFWSIIPSTYKTPGVLTLKRIIHIVIDLTKDALFGLAKVN